ncbi:DoxX family protein [Ruegeria arenilitoris]|uniref:DoxX family protein n=1 Tax=Ruegeria arenilitoris TaxID=1173585 RepID=UPI00147FA916|nr:DoxX family protein [Ruegeria arenilitoris]
MPFSLPNLRTFLIDPAPRLLLGGIFLMGALDGFAFIFTGAHLIHPPTSSAGLALEAALKEAGFLWPLMKGVELAGALLLLSNRAPALGLALLAPIMAVIVLFHATLNPGGLPLAFVLIVCGILILWVQRSRFSVLFETGTPGAETRPVPAPT